MDINISLKPIAYAWKHALNSYNGQLTKEKYPITAEAIEFYVFKNKTDTAYIAVYEDHVVFAFRGTENLKGWLSDLDVYPLKNEQYMKKNLKDGKWGRGTIHDGLYTGWLFFKSCIDTWINSCDIEKLSKLPIITTGHSRGGGFAELCSRHLAKNRSISSSCFTFGAPSVGTKRYRDQFRLLPINGTRVVNGWDMVTFLPPKALGFTHGCANLVWNKKALWKRFIPWSRMEDHKSKNYNKYITKRFING